MKSIVTVLILAAAVFGGWKLLEYRDGVKEREAKQATPMGISDGKQLPGVPAPLEALLQESYKNGAAGLKEWLEKYRRSPLVKDPRRAWIELDYVVLITHDNTLEAKRVFAAVKQRVPAQSPVYPRIKSLEKTYE